jgi:hypothetical protein
VPVSEFFQAARNCYGKEGKETLLIFSNHARMTRQTLTVSVNKPTAVTRTK